ncbi:MAG: tRNA (adenosine(37)-N6)-dimethylallyltransferase MiaA [Devosiaceae bacterium]|nr:tRNA (adenosine(37)-N6)-dimethylallyltransferase MiaA [Devosiaceae bacterium MH13]
MAKAVSELGGQRAGLLIAGPTASGKSRLALAIAERLPRPLIINCDSMQVYRDLSILTARPEDAVTDRVPHALYGTRDAADAASVTLWREDVRSVLAAHPEHDLLFVGGTGLYFRVLLEGIAPVPPVDPIIRETVRGRREAEGSAALHAELDEAMAGRLSPTDSQRVCRALEVLLSTGRSLADWQAAPTDGPTLAFDPARAFVLAPQKDWLEPRIAERAAQMLDGGALDEVQRLMARHLDPDLPAMRALGVAALAAYLQGDAGRSQTLERLVVETRQYAKRQMTWFRGHMSNWTWIDPENTDLGAFVANLTEGAAA